MPQFTPNIQAHCVHVHLMCEMFTVELAQTWLSTIDFTQAQICFHDHIGIYQYVQTHNTDNIHCQMLNFTENQLKHNRYHHYLYI